MERHTVLETLVPKWRGSPVLFSEVMAGLGTWLVCRAVGAGLAVVAAGLVTGLLWLLRRLDDSRSDHLLARWRRTVGRGAYVSLGADTRHPGAFRRSAVPEGPRTLRLIGAEPGGVLSMLRRRPSLAEQIPYWDVVDLGQGAVLVTPEGRGVIGYTVQGLHLSYAEATRIQRTFQVLQEGLVRLPDGFELQVRFDARRDDAGLLKKYVDLRSDASELIRTQARERATFLQSRGPKTFRLTAFVSRTGQGDLMSFGRLDLRKIERGVQASADAFEGLTRATGLSAERMDGSAIYAAFAHHVRAPEGFPSAGESPRTALATAAVTWGQDGFRLGDEHIQVMTLQKLGADTFFPGVEAIFARDYGVDFTLTSYLRVPSRAATQARTRMLEKMAFGRAHGMRVPSAAAHQHYRDLAAASAADGSGRDRLVHVGCQIAVSGSVSEVEKGSRALREAALSRSLTFVPETLRHDRQYLLCQAPGGLGRFDRWLQVQASNAADLLALFGSRPPCPAPGLLLETDRGELWGYDVADRRRPNWNLFVTGASGSGKSVLVNALIAGAFLGSRGSRGRVLLIDFAGPEKSSYRSLASVFGGRFVSVVEQEGLNPFPPREEAVRDGELDPHVESVLTTLIDLLTENSQRGQEAKSFRILIQDTVRRLYAGRAYPCFESFLATLSEGGGEEPKARRLTRLVEGTLRAPGGRLFASRKRLTSEGDFVVFDLFGAEQYAPDVQEALVFLVCEHARALAFSRRRQGERLKLLGFDEMPQVIRHEGVLQLIRQIYATARGYGTATLTISQKYLDFVESGLAETVLTNSTTSILLSHASDVASQRRVARDMGLTDREQELLQSLEVRKGEYSELLFRINDGERTETTKVRLALAPLEYEIYSSDAEDRDRREAIQRRYPDLPPLEVFRRCARLRVRPS